MPGPVMRALFTALAVVASVEARAETTNLITRAALVEGSCTVGSRGPLLALGDSDPTTHVSRYLTTPCDLLFRFDAPVVASGVEISTLQADVGDANRSSYVSIWGSHQGFGYGLFRLGEAKFDASQGAVIAFETPIKLRSLLLSFNGSSEGGWPRGSTGHDTRVSDVVLTAAPEEAAETARWPRPPLAKLKGKSDPLGSTKETRCDALAGLIFNPDGNGTGRSDLDVDVPEALAACEIAVAKQPDSLRLATNLARAEVLAERAPQAIARLTSPLLEGYAPAQVLLAESFENGRGVQKNAPQARALYEAAAAQDYGPALHWLGTKAMAVLSARIARGEVAGDIKADANLARAVEVGYVPAAPLLVEQALQHGLIPARQAYDLSEAAALFGDPDAMISYGTNLFYGFGLPLPRKPEAKTFFARAANLNRHTAMTNYAISGGEWYWRKRAAYNGAYFPLEQLARETSDPIRRAALARLAFEKALEEAQSDSGSDGWTMEWLADFYAQGFGTEKDLEQAKTWRCRARAAGNPRAFQSRLPEGLGACGDE